MKSSYRITAIVLCLVLATCQTFAASEPAIAALDWSKVDVERQSHEMPHGVLAVNYKINKVVQDTEIIAFSFVHTGANISFPFGSSFSGSCRDGFDGSWCNGGGHIEKVSKEGILYSLDLSWGTRGPSKTTTENGKNEYTNSILIPWQPKFTYQDNVITLEARIAWFTQPAMDNLVDRKLKK